MKKYNDRRPERHKANRKLTSMTVALAGPDEGLALH